MESVVAARVGWGANFGYPTISIISSSPTFFVIYNILNLLQTELKTSSPSPPFQSDPCPLPIWNSSTSIESFFSPKDIYL